MDAFNFQRARALNLVYRDGADIVFCLAASPRHYRVPHGKVRGIVSKDLHDMSLRVADFGDVKAGVEPTEAILAVGSEDKLAKIRRDLQIEE